MNSSKTFQPQVPVSDTEHVLINTKEKVGTWTFGDYYRGVSKKYNKEVMVKMVETSKFPLKQKNLETEVNLLQKLKTCPNVVEFMEYKYYDKTLVIVTEQCNAGNLRNFIKTHAPLPEDVALKILLQMVCGLKALHQQNYTHTAVRPECILMQEVNGNMNAKLSEFIFARGYKGDNTAKFPVAYDSSYLAPEVLRDLKFDPKSDIWSLGMIYYEMLFGSLPWTGKTQSELKDNILNKKLDLRSKKGVSDTSMDFLTRCLQRDVKKRIGWKDIGEHRLLFRGLFLNDDGTYKLFNEDYGQHSPRRGNLVYGNRNAESSFPASPKSCRVLPSRLDSPKPSENMNQSVTSARSNFALKPTSPFHVQDQEQSFGNGSKDNVIGDIPSKSDITKERSVSPVSLKRDQTAPQEDEVLQKKPDPEFYSNLVSKVGETDDYYAAKFMNKEPLDQKGPFSKKSFAKPFKWLANKAEIVGEIYEMAIRNPYHCCYERIIQLLNQETNSWNTISMVSEMQKQFTHSVESTSKQEEAQPMAYPKGIKNHSLAKKEKNQAMAVLIEDIVSSLTNANENCKANNEDMVQIAANFKVLREYEEIGDSVMKELDVMKNSLIVFYRKRDHGHIRYILSIRNLI